MAKFVTRVELHGATYADYETLHTAMAAVGFRRSVLGTDGKWYQLPTAEYSIDTDNDLAWVRDAARRAANTTGRSSWVVSVKSDGMAWYLQPA